MSLFVTIHSFRFHCTKDQSRRTQTHLCLGKSIEIVSLSKDVQDLSVAAQDSLQPRPPEGTELRLMELLAKRGDRQEADLRELITNLLEQGEEEVDLQALMGDLQSLFQKNQIAIHISQLHRERESDGL